VFPVWGAALGRPIVKVEATVMPGGNGTRVAGALRVIRKLKSGKYRLYSRKPDPKSGRRRNLGTFDTRAAAEKHERAVQFFKRR